MNRKRGYVKNNNTLLIIIRKDQWKNHKDDCKQSLRDLIEKHNEWWMVLFTWTSCVTVVRLKMNIKNWNERNVYHDYYCTIYYRNMRVYLPYESTTGKRQQLNHLGWETCKRRRYGAVGKHLEKLFVTTWQKDFLYGIVSNYNKKLLYKTRKYL